MDYFDWGNDAVDPGAATAWTSGGDLVDANVDPSTLVNPTSFNVGPGQNPSDIYQKAIDAGLLTPGANVPVLAGGGLTGPGSGAGGPGGGKPGLFTDAAGNINWAALLGALAPILGGMYTANRTSAAQGQMLNAINNANQQITSNLGGNTALYQPYREAGAMGLQRLENLPQSNLASRFPALGTPASQMPGGFSLNTLARGR